ncbi:rhodanese-like domain-containing protein [Streptomyces aidingensis]|uniref:Rhodanese-related sulfurtransferase n=1 Tax=Streptomyces aidingensis TaxID=910347 RepID=A0A1I1QNJ9_9ACTN|nr:rhodanese-like domain-containing protein [Streptomyces aidingensis]SFD23694.1 Rhodanese-related sulfurtransferase [Streptomyces aidingensis]
MFFAQLPTVTVDEIADGALLLDVREADEWAAGHAPAAVHIPMSELLARIEELTGLAQGRTVHVICKVGGRSAQVTGALLQRGLDAVNVDGGMVAWQARGLPMTAESADPAVVL